MPEQGKVRENSGEGSFRYRRANRSSPHARALGRKTHRTISQVVPSAVSLWIAGREQLYQVKRMFGGIGNVLLSTFFSNFNCVNLLCK